jgi:acyl-CoA synthetase (AMP-forming)/AMP-acid ligase II
MTIYHSTFAPILVPEVSITDYITPALIARADVPVIIDGTTGRALTGAMLLDLIRRLAGGLTTRGLGPGHAVALMAPNIPEYAAIFHGVAYAGGTITTVNPLYTADELRFQLNDARADILITIPAFLDTAKAAIVGTGVTQIFVLGDGDATPFSALLGAPQMAQTPVDLHQHTVVLPYSSGTTGLPKGVMLSHANLVANVEQLRTVFPVGAGEVSIAVLPYFHIYGMNAIMNPFLVQEAVQVTMPRFDLELFLRLIQTHKVAKVFVVPPVVLALAKHPMIDSFDLSSLRTVFSAAAPLGADLSNACAARLGAEVIQGYGMTELSPVSHATVMGQSVPGSSGRAVPLTECRIIDTESGQDAAPGGVGEVWIKGPQVMQGYLNNPGATASTLDAEGWLHTGDIARIDGGGDLFIVDRLKELIKYKGFQVPPAELEALLQSHPAVADVAVVGMSDEEAGELPVAFIVTRAGHEPDAPALQAFVAGHVASYKQIRHVRFIDAIPKSASGKILRRVLKAQG